MGLTGSWHCMKPGGDQSIFLNRLHRRASDRKSLKKKKMVPKVLRGPVLSFFGIYIFFIRPVP